MADIIIAADLGGTNLRMAAIKPNGDIVSREKVDTPRSRMRDEVTKAVSDLALNFAMNQATTAFERSASRHRR